MYSDITYTESDEPSQSPMLSAEEPGHEDTPDDSNVLVRQSEVVDPPLDDAVPSPQQHS